MTPLAMYAACIGLFAFQLGTLTSVDREGDVELASPGLAGSGAAVFLGVVAAQVFA